MEISFAHFLVMINYWHLWGLCTLDASRTNDPKMQNTTDAKMFGSKLWPWHEFATKKMNNKVLTGKNGLKIFSSSWFPIEKRGDFGGYAPSFKAGMERKSFTSSEKSCNTISSENISGCRWDSLRHFNRCSHITWDRRAENTGKLLSWCLAVCQSLTRCCCCCCWGRWTHLFSL